jgi:predicted XRE-type DNA-binding protein
MSLKAGLAGQIVRAMRERGGSQRQTAELVGLKQPDLSNIARARLDGISVERLLVVLNRLGHRVEVRVERAQTEDARTLVIAA